MTTWLPHYTPADIAAAKDIAVWAAATCRSTTALARMIGGSNGTLSMVLRGCYKSSPTPILARLLHAAGQRLPAGWESLLPAEPDPAPVVCASSTQCCSPKSQARPAMTAWEPGAALAAVSAERAAILKALSKSSSQNPMPRQDLLDKLGDTPQVIAALDALIAERAVMDAVLIRGGKGQAVLYPVGRLPVARPGPKVGAKKGRGAAISIPPSTRSGGGKGIRP